MNQTYDFLQRTLEGRDIWTEEYAVSLVGLHCSFLDEIFNSFMNFCFIWGQGKGAEGKCEWTENKWDQDTGCEKHIEQINFTNKK